MYNQLFGRTVSVIDISGHTATAAYDVLHDQTSVITRAMGHTTCHRYDQRGRKTTERGTGIHAAVFTCAVADRQISLTTFRGAEEDSSTIGLAPRKTYANGSSIAKIYDAYNRLSMGELAHGLTKPHCYNHVCGLLLGTTSSGGSTTRNDTCNHLGQLIQVTDDAGVRVIRLQTAVASRKLTTLPRQKAVSASPRHVMLTTAARATPTAKEASSNKTSSPSI